MSAPGSGKTTTLRRTIAALQNELRIGVMEADIASDVDARAIAETGSAVAEGMRRLIQREAEQTVRQADADAHAHGLPVTADVGGVLSKIFPDGHVEPVKPAPAIAKKKTLAA